MRPILSVVVPCFDEEAGLQECHRRLSSVLDSTCPDGYEIVYVNDGSRDHTQQRLDEIHGGSDKVTILQLSRNFGHQAAVSAGLAEASGKAVLIIDADLQDPPEVIPNMLELWKEGYEVIYGVRTSREGESRFKIQTARLFYMAINRLSDIEIPLDAGDFRLLDRKAVDALLAMPERHRMMRAMSSWIGFRQHPFYYMRSARFAGSTKYPLAKMVGLALDGIFSFSTIPLRIMSLIGFALSCLSFCGIVYSLAVRIFTTHWVAGWATVVLAVLLIGGVQMIFLGIIGEYIGRIYTESKDRPLYFVRSRSPLTGPQSCKTTNPLGE